MTRNRRSTRRIRMAPPPTANAADKLRTSLRGNGWSQCDGPCGTVYPTSDIQIDHVIPLSQGGTDTPENLQLLCWACHRTKTVSEGAIA
ncbi:HNH endonuclease [Streptomyces malaysiensis]